MRCLRPRTVGFQADGKTIAWSQKQFSKEFPVFPFPCGKCVECRAEQGSTKAVRCVHESMMHDSNCFITLTYDDRFLKSPRLDLSHVQKFLKRLRARYGEGIGVVYTGEYGDTEKRPHWHLLVFGWEPRDPEFKYTSDHGDKVYTSRFLGFRDKDEVDSFYSDPRSKRFKSMLWKYGVADYGCLTYKSASYVCRYALKKLVHGFDQDHDFHPLHNFRNRIAIGRRWLEKYWRDVFSVGSVILPDGNRHSIPRYYLTWLQREQPEAFVDYVTELKAKRCAELALKAEKEKLDEDIINWNRLDAGKGFQRSRLEARRVIVEERIKRLQSHMKGDI